MKNKKKSNTTKKIYNKKKSRKVLRKKPKHVKSQKGGFRVKLSRKQLRNLYEVRGIDNRQCVATSLNILGLPSDAIKRLSMEAAGPDISRKAAKLMDEYVMQQQGRIIGRQPTESVSFVGLRSIPTQPFSSYKQMVEPFIKKNIKKGHITLMLYSTSGQLGHAIVIGRTARAGTIFIIDAQTHDDIRIPYTLDTCKGGIKKGDEALRYLIRSNVQGFIELYIPKNTVVLDSAEPSLREDRIAVNPQPFNISTASMVGEQDGGPFGGPFGSHVSQQYSYTPIFSQLAQQPAVPAQSAFPAPQSAFPAPQSAFPAPQSAFPAPQSAFPARQSAFPARQSAFPAPQSAFPAPQSAFPAPQSASSFTLPAQPPASSFTLPAQPPAFPAPQSAFPAPHAPQYTQSSSYTPIFPKLAKLSHTSQGPAFASLR